jgi:hypothetical protein
MFTAPFDPQHLTPPISLNRVRTKGSRAALRFEFDGERDSFPTAQAQTRQPAPESALLEGVDQRDQHARAGCTDGMAERNRAAVNVLVHGIA